MENKLFSREWVYNNIFELSDAEKAKMFEGVITDQKQAFRMEQIATEGNDPAETGEKAGEEGEGGEEMARRGDWGGSEKDPRVPDVDRGTMEYDDIKKANKYATPTSGKREFKGGSPLYPGKGATIVKQEGLMASLKKAFGKDIAKEGLLNESALLDDEND